MENMLQRHAKIDAVWCQDDDMLKGVMQAIKESGRTDIKTVLGGAGSKDIMKMVMDGDQVVRATVTYPPSMVASGIALAVTGVKGEKLGNMYHTVPSRVILAAELVDSSNVGEFYTPDAAYSSNTALIIQVQMATIWAFLIACVHSIKLFSSFT